MVGVLPSVLDPRRGLARGMRALLLALVTVGVAGAAHTYVDGCLDLTGLALSLGLCWPLAVGVLGRRRSTLALLAWTGAAQVVTHAVVELTCGGTWHAAPFQVLVAHGGAVVLTTLLLARADAGLWAAHALVRAFSRLLLPLLLPAPVVRRPLPAPSAPLLPRARWLVSVRALRGPPTSPLPTS